MTAAPIWHKPTPVSYTHLDETMVKPHGKKDAGKHKEGDGPRVWNVACHRFQPACQHDEQPLSGNGGNTVKGAADTYKQCLLVRIERQQDVYKRQVVFTSHSRGGTSILQLNCLISPSTVIRHIRGRLPLGFSLPFFT